MNDREFVERCLADNITDAERFYRLANAPALHGSTLPLYGALALLRIDLADAQQSARTWEQTAHAVQNELVLSRDMAKEMLAASEERCREKEKKK